MSFHFTKFKAIKKTSPDFHFCITPVGHLKYSSSIFLLSVLNCIVFTRIPGLPLWNIWYSYLESRFFTIKLFNLFLQSQFFNDSSRYYCSFEVLRHPSLLWDKPDEYCDTQLSDIRGPQKGPVLFFIIKEKFFGRFVF